MNENSMIDIAETLLQPEVRGRIRANPRQYAIENGMIEADSTTQIKLVVCVAGQLKIPMVQASEQLSHNQLENISAGVEVNTTGSVGSIGSASTISTVFSCLGSTTSASTVGTMGSADIS